MLAAQAASQDVRNLSRFASDAAAMAPQALPGGQRIAMTSSSSLDSQLPDNEELQVCGLRSSSVVSWRPRSAGWVTGGYCKRRHWQA